MLPGRCRNESLRHDYLINSIGCLLVAGHRLPFRRDCQQAGEIRKSNPLAAFRALLPLPPLPMGQINLLAEFCARRLQILFGLKIGRFGKVQVTLL